jgi:hypothetical protein
MIGADPKHVRASADKTLWLLLLTDLQVPLRPINLTTADLPLGSGIARRASSARIIRLSQFPPLCHFTYVLIHGVRLSVSSPLIHDRSCGEHTNVSIAPLIRANMASILMRALVCVFLIPTLIAASSSGTFEIDLIFPRNGTWAPADAMPIVFAIQRPDLAPLIAINFISWTLVQLGSLNRQTGLIFISNIDGSEDKPYLIQRAISNTSGIEDSWSFSWEFLAGNCTAFTDPRSSSTADPKSFVYKQHGTTTKFNTSQSAPSTNWTTLTSTPSCGGSDGVAFAVTDILKVPRYSEWQGSNASCAVFSSTTTSNPCAVRLDAAAASSVSAGLAYQVCLNGVNGTATGKCTMPTMPSSSDRMAASWRLVAILCAIGFFAML